MKKLLNLSIGLLIFGGAAWICYVSYDPETEALMNLLREAERTIREAERTIDNLYSTLEAVEC